MDLPPGFPFRDPVSALTHFGFVLPAVYVTLLLCRLTRDDRTKRLSLAVFGASMILLYTASGLYHTIPLPRRSPTVEVFRRLDHSAIYVLIAGTYTPVFAVLLRGRQRAILLMAVWGFALAGIAAKWLLPYPPEGLTIALYLALGWLAVVPARSIFRAVGGRGIAWGLAGGLCYTIGAMFEYARWPVLVPGLVGWHEVFHVWVMAGTAFHVGFMLRFVVPFHYSYRSASIGSSLLARRAG